MGTPNIKMHLEIAKLIFFFRFGGLELSTGIISVSIE